MAEIRRHEMEMAEYALRTLTERYGDEITIHGPTNVEVRGATFSFAFRGIHPHDISQVLDQTNVCVRAGHHCAKPLMRLLGATATARASFYLYNDEADADALADALDGRQRTSSDSERRRRPPTQRSTQCPASKTCTARSSSTTTAARGTVVSSSAGRARRGPQPAVRRRDPDYLDVVDGVVRDIKVGGQGCSISQSSASMMSQAVKGKDVAEVKALVRRFKGMMSIEDAGDDDSGVDPESVKLGDLEALQGVVKFPVRIKCATLAWNTLLDALAQTR